MGKETKTQKVTGMAVLLQESARLEVANPKAAEILGEAAVDLAHKIGERKKQTSKK